MCSRNIGVHLGTGKEPTGLLELQSDGQPVLAASVIKRLISSRESESAQSHLQREPSAPNSGLKQLAQMVTDFIGEIFCVEGSLKWC